jgi:signal transduction histidine kinase
VPEPATVAQRAGFVEVADLIHVAATRLERQARAAGLRLSLALGRELGAINGDAGQLEEILFRLSENALFLTPRGGTIPWSAAVEANGDLRIEMGGAGLGINAAGAEGIHLAGRMVEIGYAATSARNLHMVRQLVEANGGRLEVRSNQGGSAAIITFPGIRLVPLAA